MFNCRQLGEDLSLLIKDYRVDCSTPNHVMFEFLSAMVIVTAVAGVPVLCFYKLVAGRKHKDSLHDFAAIARKVCEECDLGDKVDEDMIRDIDMRQSFNFLLDAYRSRFYYWECIDLSRKAVLTGGIVLFGRGSVAQIFLAILISFGFFSAQMKFSPYRHWEDNWLKASTEAMIFCTIVVALVLETDLTTERVFDVHFYNYVLEGMFYLLVPVAFFVVVGIKVSNLWRDTEERDDSSDDIDLRRACSGRETKRKQAFLVQVRGDPNPDDMLVITWYVNELKDTQKQETEARKRVAEALPWSQSAGIDPRMTLEDQLAPTPQDHPAYERTRALAQWISVHEERDKIDQFLGTLHVLGRPVPGDSACFGATSSWGLCKPC